MHGIEKRIVYVLRSDVDPRRRYVGITNDIRERLSWHNAGPRGNAAHTLSFQSGSIDSYVIGCEPADSASSA